MRNSAVTEQMKTDRLERSSRTTILFPPISSVVICGAACRVLNMTVAVGCPLGTDQCVPTPSFSSFSDSCFERNSVAVILQREGETFASSRWKTFPFFFHSSTQTRCSSLLVASSLWRVCLDSSCTSTLTAFGNILRGLSDQKVT